MSKEEIQELEDKLITWNLKYRIGEPVVSDEVYDSNLSILFEYYPDSEIFKKGVIDSDDLENPRMETLPFELWSMEKIKTIDEFESWIEKYNLQNETLIASPKYDGISLERNEMEDLAWTRGNGIKGQNSSSHIKILNDDKLNIDFPLITWGEAIIKREVFSDKYYPTFQNGRNMVAGKFNDDEPSDILKDIDYVRYGMDNSHTNFETKKEIFDFLNHKQKNKVPYFTFKFNDVDEDSLKERFLEWSERYELDGIIIETNSINKQKELGRERNNNPKFARAYKGNFEEVKEAVLTGITYTISKRGYLKPVGHIEPTRLDGATVTNVTLYNARFVFDMKLGIGSVVKIKRSGMVIPKVIETVSEVPFEYPNLGLDIRWNSTGVELETVEETDYQKQKKLISFFKILGVRDVSDGILNRLFELGYKTPKQVLEITKEEFEEMEGFGKRKADKVYRNIHSKANNVSKEKLMHSSNIFINLGSKKLKLLLDFDENTDKEVIKNLEGFSDISAENFINGYSDYKKWYDDIKHLVTIKEQVVLKLESNSLEGKSFVFSGVRRGDLEEIIIKNGGKISSSISKNSTHLVMKAKGTGSSKEKKAIKLNQEILDVPELETLLKL